MSIKIMMFSVIAPFLCCLESLNPSYDIQIANNYFLTNMYKPTIHIQENILTLNIRYE